MLMQLVSNIRIEHLSLARKGLVRILGNVADPLFLFPFA